MFPTDRGGRRSGVSARRGRVAVTSIFFLNGAGFGAWAARLPAVQDRVGVSEGGLAVALASLTLGALLAMPLAGWAATRFGARPATRAAVLAFGLALAGLPHPDGLALLCVATFIFGISSGSLDVVMNANAVAVERALAKPILSGVHAAFSFGGLAGAVVGALVAEAGLGVRAHLVATALVIVVAGGLAGRALLPARPESSKHFTRPPRRLWALGFIAIAALMAEGAATDWSAIYMVRSLDTGVGIAAVAFACFSLTMAAGRLFGDAAVKRVGPVALVRAGGALGACGLGVALVVGHPVAALVGFACLGLGLAAIVPVVFRAAAAVPGLTPGLGISAVSTLGYFGFIVGPPAIGTLAELFGLSHALAVVVLASALAALLAPNVTPAERDRSETQVRASPVGAP